MGSDADMAKVARESLSRSRAAGLDTALVARLNQAGPKDRVVLLEILGERGQAGSIAAMADRANDSDSEVRLAAIRRWAA